MMQRSTGSSWALGGSVFAAVMMIIIGVYQSVVGIAAIGRDDFWLVNTGSTYIYRMDTTAWGWIHLLVGILAVIAGFFIFTGEVWARTVGVALAAISAVANFFFLPYYPLWAIIVIALDIFVIWALTHSRFGADEEMSMR